MTVVSGDAHVDTSFVRVGADWTVAEAIELLTRARSTRAIVHGFVAAREAFFVFHRVELIPRLDASRAATVGDALALDTATPTPVIAVATTDATREAVVVSDGQLRGVFRPDLVSRSFTLVGAEVAPRGLAARAAAQIAVGATAPLVVTITRDGSGGVALGVARGDVVTIALVPDGAVDVDGRAEAEIAIDRDDDIPVLFRIRGREPGTGTVAIYAFVAGRGVGSISLTVQVVAAVTGANPDIERRQRIREAAPPADLDIRIYERHATRTYTMELTTKTGDLTRKPFGPIQLEGDVASFLAAFYGDIEGVFSSNERPADKEKLLLQRGSWLAERVMPIELRRALWSLRARVKSVQIQTAEPWVPWELCVLMNDSAGGIGVDDSGGFLAADFRVTRWFFDVEQHTSLAAHAFGLVVPPDTGLATAQPEREYIEGLVQAGRTVTAIRARRADVYGALASAAYDVLHFASHGTAAADAERSTIQLQGGKPLTPMDLAGVARNFGRRHPLVFLNACEVGRSGLGLGGLAGWPQGFVKAGAAAFVAPFWKVVEGSATQFARTFYATLLSGETVAASVHAARVAARTSSDPTWLAYVAYAHPEARIQ